MKPYTMPPVTVGRIVLWYDGGDRATEPVPAIVQRVGTCTLCLHVLPPGSHNGLAKDGVRHIDDPDRRAIDSAEAGAWSFCEHDLAEPASPSKKHTVAK